MAIDDLHIEKLNLNVFTTNHPSYQQFLQEITHDIQHTVLPKIEADLKNSKLKLGASDVVINQLNVELNWTQQKNWQETLSAKIVKQLTEVYLDKQNLQEFSKDIAFDLSNSWQQIRYFYRWGTFPFPNRSFSTSSLQNWENEVRKSDFYAEILEKTRFLIDSNNNNLRRILNQHSKSFISDLIKPLFAKPENEFLMECLTLNAKGFQFVNDVPKISFDSNQLKVNEHNLALNQLNQFTLFGKDFLTELSINETVFYKKNQKIIDNLVKNGHQNLTDLLKANCTYDLYQFIDFLRDDSQLKEKLDSHLLNHFIQNPYPHDLQTWLTKFAKSISKNIAPSNLIVELVDSQKRKGREDFSNTIRLFIAELQKNHPNESSAFEGENSVEKQDELPQTKAPTHIFIANAGLVLLNPFLPTFFKNLGLQTEKGDWLSKHEQMVAIYLLNFIATSEMEATEDLLILGKLLTGFPLDEPLENWEVICQQSSVIDLESDLIKKLTNNELPNILEIIHQNWYPMRNCTWTGLQTDFLTRPGLLELKENKQLKLTTEPHALDVLLPHIKWGISMIKYSWMEDVLLVEWP
ncbi:MAG: hypothetical protein IT222_05515 [Crocinitomix sp.]|nr:hypothetical protein [Crocinitomix sp.]